MPFKWEASIGNLLIALPMAVGVIVYATTDHNQVQVLTARVERGQADQTASINQLRVDMTAQIQDVRNAIANLPDVRAQVTQQDRRIGVLEIQAGEADRRLSKVEGMLGAPVPYRAPR